MEVTAGKALYEGKAKILYAVQGQDDLCIQYFKDDATAFNAEKKGSIHDKGVFNNQISCRLLSYLSDKGIPTHYEEQLSDREMLVKHVKIIPLEVIVRNRAAGSFVKRLDVTRGQVIDPPLVEFCYKRDDLGDPFVTEDHIRILNLATPEEVNQLRDFALKINELLSGLFDELGLTLVDFKLEFGKTFSGEVVLADEISPDTCRFWDKETQEVLDKDRFRFDMGSVEGAYQEVWKRISQGNN